MPFGLTSIPTYPFYLYLLIPISFLFSSTEAHPLPLLLNLCDSNIPLYLSPTRPLLHAYPFDNVPQFPNALLLQIPS